MHKRIACLFALLFLLFALPALAQEAEDVTQECTLLAGGKKTKSAPMTDRKYTTYYSLKKGGVLEAQRPDGEISGVWLQFYDRSSAMEIQAEVDGAWQVVTVSAGTYLSEWFPLPDGTQKVRMTNKSKGRAFIAELTVYGGGDRPDRSPQWQELDKADLMLLVAHPDDELLWFGGLLPTYAGERGLRVQVVYLVPSTPDRRLELLDGLWHCGVTAYPLFCDMRDVRSDTLKGQYKLWSRPKLLQKVVDIIRRVKPEVLVTQDENGEYGHGAHRVCADICRLALTQAADERKFSDSRKAYGTWHVKKLYIHLYGDDPLVLDWREPLDAFGGRDGFTVAEEALAWHVSQVKHGWQMEEGGEYDNRVFGLYYSAVGEDVLRNDLMENIDTE